MLSRDKGQHATLAGYVQAVRVRNDFNRVDSPASKAIDRVEHLERPDQIEFIDRRYDDDDDPTARWLAAQTLFRERGGHGLTHYAAASAPSTSETRTMADFGASLSEIGRSSSRRMRLRVQSHGS